MKIKNTFLFAVSLICFATGAKASPVVSDRYSDPLSGRTVGLTLSLSSLKNSPRAGEVVAKSMPADEVVVARALEYYKDDFGLKTPTKDLKTLSHETDELGVAHLKYQQIFSGVPVFGAQLSVHVNHTLDTLSMNGRLSRGTLPDVTPNVTGEEATAVVDSDWTQQFGSAPEFHYPTKLWVLDVSLLDEYVSGQLFLVYEVDVGSTTGSYRYFVDAKTKEVIYKISLSSGATYRWVFDCSYGGWLGTGTCYQSFYSPAWSYTFGRTEGESPVGANPLSYILVQSYPYETDRLYERLGTAHNYYGAMFGRNSANGVGGLGIGGSFPTNTIPASSYADYYTGMSCPNAKFNPMYSRLEFCTGLMLTDLVGHEFTHAVIYYSAGLLYQGQSGALNESFADIFGDAIERFGLGTHDWLIGASSRMGTLRSMSDPASALYDPLSGTYSNGLQPDRAFSPLFECGAADQGGVHTNSGVLNHGAYLISAGGTFNGCTIQGLGDEKMERIMYRALTRYLGQASTFSDAYQAILSATLDLYSLEDWVEVKKALKSIELDQAVYCSGAPRQDPGCSTVIDNCPSHPNQIDPGVCGCGVSSADANGNGVADCKDPIVTGITPIAPKVKAMKKAISISMTPMTGVKYYIKLVVQPKKGKSKTSYYIGTSATGTIAKLTPGSSVSVAYAYLLEGTSNLFSNYSASRKVKVK